TAVHMPSRAAGFPGRRHGGARRIDASSETSVGTAHTTAHFRRRVVVTTLSRALRPWQRPARGERASARFLYVYPIGGAGAIPRIRASPADLAYAEAPCPPGPAAAGRPGTEAE